MDFIFLILFLLVVYYSIRYAWWTKAIDYTNPRILMYHMISPHKKDAKFNGLRIDPTLFEKQLQYLKDEGWSFFTMSELVEKKDNIPSKSIAITFDDGYEDNFSNAFPILKKYNIKVTIYLVWDRHNREWSTKRKKKNSSGELMQELKLSDEQIKEMIDSGLVEIGSHTMTHDNLPTLSKEQKLFEISESKKQIEELFQIECKSFCYPFGLYDAEDKKIVQQSGYTNATTTQKGIDSIQSRDLFELKRVTVSGKDTMLAFKIKLKRGIKGLYR